MEKYFLSESNVEERQLLATLNEVINLLYELDRNYITITNLVNRQGRQGCKLNGAKVTIHILLDCYKGIIGCFERNCHLKSELEYKLEFILRRVVVLLDRLSNVTFNQRTIDEVISEQHFSYGGEWLIGFMHESLAEALEIARAEIFCDYVDWEGVYAALSAQ